MLRHKTCRRGAFAGLVFIAAGTLAQQPPPSEPDRAPHEHFSAKPRLAVESLGMDFSLWSEVRQTNGQPLAIADRECFYRLLDAAGAPKAVRVLSEVAAPMDLAVLLQEPETHFGDVFVVEGTARRITKVAVNDSHIKSRLGIDHYYEVDMFVPLGDARLRLGDWSQPDKSPVYSNRFPVTLLVRRLPPGLVEGDNLHEQIRAAAVFFKIWAYPSRYAGRFGQLQPAPLLIAAEPQVVTQIAASVGLTTSLALLALGVAIGVLFIIAWLYHREDRAARKKTAARHTRQPPPDFSHLT